MSRENLLRLEQKLINVLNDEKITWNEAEAVSRMLVETVKKNKEDGMAKFASSALFAGTVPQS